jgi:hypothetical protein
MSRLIFQAVKQFRATDVGKISVAKRYLLIDPASAVKPAVSNP